MDVTGSRIDQFSTLVSKEDRQKQPECDKQMMVQCNEKLQRPSWLKSNSNSSWAVPKTEKNYYNIDKENADPRQPCKNIFNTNQMNEDGFDIKEVVDEGDENMLPVELSTNNSLLDSPADGASGMLTSGSPMIMSSLLSGRIIFEVSHNLNLLNDDNGASPMFNLPENKDSINTIEQPMCGNINSQERRRLDFGSSVLTQSGANSNYGHGSGRAGGTFGSLRRCASVNVQKQSRQLFSTSTSLKPPEGLISPISRSNSGGQSSGFKRPLGIRRHTNCSTSTAVEMPCQAEEQTQNEGIKNATPTTDFSNSYLEHLRNDGSSKRRKRDMTEGQPPLLKSISMSALEESPSLNDSSNRSAFLYRGRKESGQRSARFSRSKSFMDPATAAQIMEACSLAELDPNRTGDTKRQLSLPVTQGHTKNEDLKNIECKTMAKLLNGEYDDRISRCRIIDARYCYEFEGGHIKGAENYGAWDEDGFLAEFFPPSLKAKMLTPKQKKAVEDLDDGGGKDESKERERREILVFHCEFSSARGPALMRLLRKKDREINKATYPALHYPECYLLHEGYKTFYETYPHLCDGSYLPMKHKDFASEERKFHKKSKSWAAGGGGTVSRTGASSRLLKL